MCTTPLLLSDVSILPTPAYVLSSAVHCDDADTAADTAGDTGDTGLETSSSPARGRKNKAILSSEPLRATDSGSAASKAVGQEGGVDVSAELMIGPHSVNSSLLKQHEVGGRSVSFSLLLRLLPFVCF